MPDEGIPTLEELEGVYWKSAYLLMKIAETNDTELYNALLSEEYITNKELQQKLKDTSDQFSGDVEFGMTIPPDKRLLKFFKFFIDHLKSGWNKLKKGDLKGGAVDITIGTAGIDLIVGGWVAWEIKDALGPTG
jgi:hypothetical protein